MALPAAAITSGTQTGASSGFLTSAAGQGLASAAGGFLGSGIGGGTASGRQRDARFNRDMSRSQIKWLANFQRQQPNDSIQRLVKDAKRAGLHPLAALGIAPSSGGSQSAALPGIAAEYPGRSPAGSAIETGIQVMQGAQRFNRQTAHQTAMAELQVEEQTLRNDWLKSQILNSETKRLAQYANAQRPAPDPAMRPRVQYKPHPSEAKKRILMHPDGTTYSIPGGSSAELLEQYIGEWADWMPETLGNAYDVLKSQWRNKAGIQPGNTFYDRHFKNYKAPKPIFSKPRKFRSFDPKQSRKRRN